MSSFQRFLQQRSSRPLGLAGFDWNLVPLSFSPEKLLSALYASLVFIIPVGAGPVCPSFLPVVGQASLRCEILIYFWVESNEEAQCNGINTENGRAGSKGDEYA